MPIEEPVVYYMAYKLAGRRVQFPPNYLPEEVMDDVFRAFKRQGYMVLKMEAYPNGITKQSPM